MGKIRVLIIDKDDSYIKRLTEVLKKTLGPSCAVATANDEEIAVYKIANDTLFNLIFMNGNNVPAELTKKVQKMRSLSPESKLVLMLTEMDLSTSQGASAAFDKDCTDQEMTMMIRRVMAVT